MPDCFEPPNGVRRSQKEPRVYPGDADFDLRGDAVRALGLVVERQHLLAMLLADRRAHRGRLERVVDHRRIRLGDKIDQLSGDGIAVLEGRLPGRDKSAVDEVALGRGDGLGLRCCQCHFFSSGGNSRTPDRCLVRP